EAWIILDIDETGGSAWIGFTDGVADEQLREWYYSQDSDAMLGAMNEVELHPGDTLFVPAGVPHAIGQGVLLLELQEPADLSIILEYAPFPRLARDAGLLDMDVGTALAGIDRSSFAGERLADAVGAVPASGSGPLFPHAAGSFFRAEAVSVDAQTTARWEPQFAILVITEGSAVLESEAGHMDVAEGDVALIPHGAGDNRLTGDARGFRCMPPEPEM
ncbi:MAG: phosphoheptose isomerase, partial [Microbacteriaceae bacterium]|nr:phosphoheptose isomerase [Microbacteriaceae bacterium]